MTSAREVPQRPFLMNYKALSCADAVSEGGHGSYAHARCHW